jgi:hypothetical protein
MANVEQAAFRIFESVGAGNPNPCVTPNKYHLLESKAFQLAFIVAKETLVSSLELTVTVVVPVVPVAFIQSPVVAFISVEELAESCE